jgi:transcriptional regulator with XRE-family HTH domain
MDVDYTMIGRRIKDARKDKKVTQEQLAERSGLSTNHISHIEIGSSPLSLKALLSICDALSITADSILYDSLTQINRSQQYANIDKCFLDASPVESYIMLSVATAAKNSLRVKLPTKSNL